MLSVTHVTISETLCDIASVHDITASNAGPGSAGVAGPDLDDNNDAEAYEKDAYKYKSLIRVHTVNARFVGQCCSYHLPPLWCICCACIIGCIVRLLKYNKNALCIKLRLCKNPQVVISVVGAAGSVKVVEEVTCVCYSGAPEGVSVNGVAAGLRSGGLRLYSSWDLRPLLYLPPPDARAPLLSLTYSSDSSLLFACYGGGVVLAWDSCSSQRPAPVRILPAHALF
ncbi:hypothetical protein HF086_007189 [Spodoptera exigua]|uniref:Uncharacterized protein n=1 Tax=Spodoptera exigua TaxID=7107 RepID=A0A922MSW8_SPOEX|nr:hypothetical protein HF086_007189 [Spodoptera exigua]